MAARAGITRAEVIDTAVAMIDDGAALDEVSLGAVARRVGIRPQSMYAHVDGADGLGQLIAAAGLTALASTVTAASIGVGGLDAVRAIVRSHLRFAAQRPALYEAALHPPGDDPELQAAIAAVSTPLDIVLSTLGIREEDRVHWTWLFLSMVYGYVVLHHTGRFTLPVDTETTEDHLVDMLVAQLSPQPT